MATELGQAYVQIMPSAKGISGSIQKVIKPEATAAGRSAGTTIATSISKNLGGIGKSLTNKITLPVVGAATAVGGLVGALGFKRLVGLDTAKAKLRGLGYESKEVERISGQVETAIMGGMTTMGEGVDIAAGALAAGVKEGAELERYIKLVGDAAVGANRPVDEMAQIFHRVQGGGRLMTQELNMIEQSLPGFSQAMADEVADGSLEAFREMVTNGEVGSEDFLNVMDSFAGGMAEAYSDSWAGMAKNTLAYVGIIGEALLEGLFEDGKEGLANFIEVLKSDELQAWATETGEKIRDVASTIVEIVKGIMEWWSGLGDNAKILIGIITGLAVAIGPILLGISKVIGLVTTLAPLFKLLGVVIGGISLPVTAVVAAIIAAATLIFVYWEPIKEFFINLWETIKELGLLIWENLQEGWQNAVEVLTETWQSVKEFFVELWEGLKETTMEFIESLMELWNLAVEGLKEAWSTITEFFTELWQSIQEIFINVYEFLNEITGGAFGQYVETIQMYLMTAWEIIQSIWDYVKETFSNVLDFLKALVTGDFQGMKDAIQNQMQNAQNLLSNIWSSIVSFVSSFLSNLLSRVSSIWSNITSTISSFMSSISSTISSIWSSIVSTISSFLSNISSSVSNIFNSLGSIVSGAMGNVLSAISTGMRGALNTVTNIASSFFDAGRNIVSSIADGIKGAVGKVTGAISDVTSKIRDFLPFSPPKTGPLIDIMDVKWGETIGGGIEKGEGAVEKAMDSILDFDLTRKSNFRGRGRNNGDVVHLLGELIRAVEEGKYIVMDDRVVGTVLEPQITEIQERNKGVSQKFV